MSRLGSHCLASEDELRLLMSLTTDQERVAYVDKVIDETYDEREGTDYDKAWSLIHSALQRSNPCSDYLERTTSGPASWAILGTDDVAVTDEAIVTCARAESVAQAAEFLSTIDAEQIRIQLSSAIAAHDCRNLSDEDAEYAAAWYPRLKDFYMRAAKARSPVIFLGDLV